MSSSQKFISKNRAPRVQIEYDIEVYGAEKKVQLPFVMGVMSDLSGKTPAPPVADRKFLEIDVDNFNDRMAAVAPSTKFSVPNTLTGEGNLAIDLTFTKMDDFGPEAIAERVDALRPLLEARRRLTDLATYMDGKSGAETLIEKLLAEPALMAAVTGDQQAAQDVDAALDSLRAALPDQPVQKDTNDAILASLVAQAPAAKAAEASRADVLDSLQPPVEPNAVDDHASALEGLRSAKTVTEPKTETADDVLSGIARTQTVETGPGSEVDAALSSLTCREEIVEVDTSDEVLAGIERVERSAEREDVASILGSLETPQGPSADQQDDTTGDVLAALADSNTPSVPAQDTTADILAGLDTTAPDTGAENNDLDDILAGLDNPTLVSEPEEAIDDILSQIDTAPSDATGIDDLDALLGDLGASEGSETDDDGTEDLNAPDDLEVADTPLDDLGDLLGDSGRESQDGLDLLLSDTTPDAGAPDDTDLDDLLTELDANSDDVETDDLLADTSGAADDGSDGDDLDALLRGDDAAAQEEPTDDLDALLAELDAGSDEADIDDLDVDDIARADAASEPAVAQSPFGVISTPRPERASLNRKRFRMAVFGDFTGRAANGLRETGATLAARTPIPLDVDTIDEIIERFATTLKLKIGNDGDSVEIPLKELDDLNPDEIYENVALFDEISGLRKQLAVGSMADRTTAQLKDWSERHGTPIKLPKRSASTAVPVNLKLSDFQALIGDTNGALTPSGPADNLIAQVVGPHIIKTPDAGAAEMTTAVDEALSAAMRLVLHHPDFQAIEAQWRSLDMLARRIETDSTLEIVLYDVSAEELAADLAGHEDLAESGLFKLVTDVLDPEEGSGGFSALFGLYTFEETPPHAELLARIGQIGAHVDAPFFSAITPRYLETAKEDRHPLVAENWDALRALPEAAYVALSSPRFLLRQPYGAKSEPIHAFNFEEFTQKEGLKGMLWANPVVLTAILLAGTYKKDGIGMNLGSLMSLGDLPFYYVSDRYGDQVALPCTERNLTSYAVQMTLGRGYMPVVWIKGRNEIRLGSFRSLAGDIIAGPWEDETPAKSLPSGETSVNLKSDMAAAKKADDSRADDTSLDEMLSDTETDETLLDDDADTSLDDLLSAFDDDDTDDDEMDPDLAAP